MSQASRLGGSIEGAITLASPHAVHQHLTVPSTAPHLALSPSLLIMEHAACWFKRHYPDYCVCNGVSSSSCPESDVDAVNFELYHTLHPGDEIDVFAPATCPTVKGATGDNSVRCHRARHQARPGKGKGPAGAALSQLMWGRLSPGAGVSSFGDQDKDDQETITGRAGPKEKNENVVITELNGYDMGLAHATPFDVVVHGVPRCTEVAHPKVLSLKDDGLCVVKSHVRPRNTYGSADRDGVTVVMESLVARHQ